MKIEQMEEFETMLVRLIRKHKLASKLHDVNDDDIECGTVVYNFGKYRHGVSGQNQDIDFYNLCDIDGEITDIAPNGCSITIEYADKYNQIIVKKT